jgi:hypothetical protein
MVTQQTKFGATFKFKNPNTNEESTVFCNRILLSGKDLIKNGFEQEPIPTLGSSMLPVNSDQVGVQAPISGLVLTNREAGEVVVSGDTEYQKSVGYKSRFTYKNTNAQAVAISEVGYLTLNRALFTDAAGYAAAWQLESQDELIVEVVFTIAYSGVETPITISCQDGQGNVVDTYTASVLVGVPEDVLTTVWWKLLSENNDSVQLIDENGLASSIVADISYNGRDITVSIDHRPNVAISIAAIKLALGDGAPFYRVSFDRPISIPKDNAFKYTLKINW